MSRGVLCGCGEIASGQIRRLSVGWFGDGGSPFLAQPKSLDVVLAHDTCDSFVIDPPLTGRRS